MDPKKFEEKLYGRVRHPEHRRSVLIFSSVEKDESHRITRALKSGKDNMSRKVRRIAERIESEPDISMPVVQFHITEERQRTPEDIYAQIDNICQEDDSYRAAVILHDGCTEFMNAPCAINVGGTNVSHLVEVGLKCGEFGWHACQGASCARVIVKNEYDLHLLNEDIALDIAYFNALFRDAPLDIAQKRQLSIAKVEVARKYLGGGSTAFGPIHGKPGYISLASLCYREPDPNRTRNQNEIARADSFDLKTYKKIWNDVLEKSQVNPPVPDEWELFSRQYRRFREAGNIDPRKVFSKWLALPEGEHILARLSEKCGDKEDAEALCSLFGGTTPRIGKWDFYHRDLLDGFAKYTNYISFLLMKR